MSSNLNVNISSATMTKSIITLSFFIICSSLFAQDYYWVGGSGNWSDYENHWATSSGGSTFHTQAPTSEDNVFFDANSFSLSGQSLTIDAEANCLDMDWTGVTNFPTINGSGIVLNVHGSLTLAADMTANLGFVEFESTTTGNTITTNGTAFGASSIIRFYGSGGEWSLQDNLATNSVYMVNGTLNTNNHNISSDQRFNITGAGSKTLNLGSSEITSERWWNFASNLTLNAGTSKIIVSSMYAGNGSYTYYDVEFTNYGNLFDDASFNEIIIQEGVELELKDGDVFTVNSLVSEGTKSNLVTIISTTDANAATLSSSNTITVDYVQLQDVHASGTGTFTANNSVDNGNNSGWTINAITGQNYYWVNNGGNWSDYSNHWATASGGTTMHTSVPGSLDNVFFDANSFSSGFQDVIVDEEANFNNMDWAGVTNNPTLDAPSGSTMNAYGSVTFVDGMHKDIFTMHLESDATVDFYYAPNGTGSISYLSVLGDGIFNFQDDISFASMTLNGGTTNFNDITVDLNFDFQAYGGDGINMGASLLNIRTMNVSGTTYTIDPGTSTINVTTNFYGGGYTYNNVVMDGTGIIEDDNTFAQLEITAGSDVSLTAGSNQTITSSLVLTGTKANPIVLNTTAGGTQASITKASGTVSATYLVMQDIDATGGAIFNATETVDNGNNTGWNITGLTGEDFYWVGGTGDWTDYANHWATTSGGSTMHTDVPGVLDNVIFDHNSFSSAGQVVTVDVTEVSFNDMTHSGVTNSPILSANSRTFNVYGSLNLDGSMESYINRCIFSSSEAEIIDMSGASINDFDFTGSGSWTFQSAIDIDDLNHYSGSIDFNDQTVDVSFQTSFYGADMKEMTLGTSEYFSRSFKVYTGENITFDGSSSSITSSSTFDISANSGSNSFSFNDLTFIKANPTDEAKVYKDMILNTLTLTEGIIMELTDNITLTVNNLIAVGTEALPIEIRLLENASVPSTISQATGTVNGDYLILSDLNATGGATFNAYNSVNNGNVSGWIFHKNDQTIDFPELSDQTFGDSGFELSATATSGLEVSFSIISGPATLTDGFLAIDGVGTVQVKAEQTGNIDYNPAPSVINEFEVFKADQTIIFDALTDKTYGDEAFTLIATGGDSGNPVTFSSSNPDVASIDSNEITIIGSGTATITASQSGNDNYNAAVDVARDLVVNKADQTITFNQLADYQIGVDTDPITLNATASSELEVAYEVSGPASLNGNLLTPISAGTVTVTASQAGNANYNAAPDMEVSFEVTESTTLGVSAINIQVYPNPVTDRFEVHGITKDDHTSISIFSLKGELVRAYTNSRGVKEISDLKPGVYLMKIFSGSQEIYSAKLAVR